MALKGIKVIEMVGLAPGPLCGLFLKDFGAEVIRVDKCSEPYRMDLLVRGKRTIILNIKTNEGCEILKKLCANVDVLIDPFRPGKMEKLGLGPNVMCKLNSRLIYARLTGYGQTGPLKNTAGHDINYTAISGILSLLGLPKPNLPNPPINLLADFAGGALICALGICLSIIERSSSGKGQVIDASMIEGLNYLSSFIYETRKPETLANQLIWPNINERGKNFLDGGCPFYSVYKTKDEKYMAVGALEPLFFKNLLTTLEIDENKYNQIDPDCYEDMRKEIKEKFLSKTRQEWIDKFNSIEACVTPVLEIDEIHNHPHHKYRKSFLPNGSPRPAPLLDRTPGHASGKVRNNESIEILKEYGYDDEQINLYIIKGIIQPKESIISKL